MTAEGVRGCAWRAAGRRCRGCRHADVSRHRTQPYRTVPYHTVSYLTAGTYGKAYLTLSLKESQGERKPLWETSENVENVWKTCFKALRPGVVRCGCGGAWGRADRGDVRVRQGLLVGHSPARAFGRCGCGGRFWLARCGGRAVRDAGAAQGALAGFLSERKNA